MHNWTKEEMREYEDYLDSLTEDEFEKELEFLRLIGNSKLEGKNLVPYESEYLC
jgi:hypothetical protein